MICSSQLSRRRLRAARSLTYSRTTIRASAATRATKNHHVTAVPSPFRRLRRRRCLGKARRPLAEKRLDPFRAFLAHGMRGDRLALENHLRLEGPEGLRDEALGGAV